MLDALIPPQAARSLIDAPSARWWELRPRGSGGRGGCATVVSNQGGCWVDLWRHASDLQAWLPVCGMACLQRTCEHIRALDLCVLLIACVALIWGSMALGMVAGINSSSLSDASKQEISVRKCTDIRSSKAMSQASHPGRSYPKHRQMEDHRMRPARPIGAQISVCADVDPK